MDEERTLDTEVKVKGGQEGLAGDKAVQTISNDATHVILKARSPSCGCGDIYDGTFSGTLTSGDGVTTALLKRHGITVTSM